MLQHDGRRDLDADFGKKSYKGINEDGTAWEKIKTWFGYKIHLLVDADYELPVAYSVTKASTHDAPEGHNLLDKVSKNQPQVLMNCDYLMGDRGYDDTKLIAKLWDEYQIRPIIDGMKKMKFRCGLALCVMLAMALGRARQGQMKLIRSLVQTRAA